MEMERVGSEATADKSGAWIAISFKMGVNIKFFIPNI